MQAGSAQPNSHSIPRTSSSLPSMAHIACALRWKLNDARREIAAAEALAKASMGAFVLMRPPPRVPPPRPDCGLPPPPSNSHRPLRPLYTRAPFIYPRFPCVISVTSRASARSLADFPPFPPTCAQVRNSTIYLKLTRPRRGEAVIAVWNNPTGLGGRCGATLGLVGRALWR